MGIVADLVRVLFVFLPGAALLGMSVTILVRYFQGYRIVRQAAREAGVEFHWWGLLPRHVWLVTLSYLLLIKWAFGHVIEDLDEPFHWHVVYISVAFITGALSLWDVLGHQRKVRETHADYSVPRGCGRPRGH